MTEKLLVLSDMWGVKKELWITSYFGYLQHYYDIEFYDIKTLGNIDIPVCTDENLHQAFLDGGIDTAVAHLKSKITEPKHVLAFSMGAAIAWKAALEGMQIHSFTAVSGTRLRLEKNKPKCPIKLIYGEKDEFKPNEQWYNAMDIAPIIVPGFGHNLYSDDKIVKDVCYELLTKAIKKAL